MIDTYTGFLWFAGMLMLGSATLLVAFWLFFTVLDRIWELWDQRQKEARR